MNINRAPFANESVINILIVLAIPLNDLLNLEKESL